MSETRAKCKDCRSRGSDRFCVWLGAFLEPGVNDDPECEGFRLSDGRPKSLGKRNAGPSISSRQVRSSKGSGTCPKASPNLERERQDILQAIRIKTHGSVVKQLVKCYQPGCRCSSGELHGPYFYWRYFEDGKGRKKYLGKNLPVLLDKPLQELQGRLREVDQILGQETKENFEPRARERAFSVGTMLKDGVRSAAGEAK